MDMKITMLEGEYWYGMAAIHGTKFPLNAQSSYAWHPTANYTGNQESPILLSSKGRYLWSDKPYDVDVENGVITVTNAAEDFVLSEGHGTLRAAFSDASAAMFVFIPLVFLFAEKQHKASSWVYMLTFALLITPFPEWFKADINQFTIFLASFGISDIQNANNLISPAATQFILIILFYQIINRMKSKKLAKQETPAEQISDN